MTLPTNPYIAGAPLRGQKGFFGRQDTLEWVERELRNSQTNALVLFGQRRIGKTTLLLQLARNLSQDEFLPIYFDLQDQATRPLGKTLTDIAEILCERANLDLGELGPFDDQGHYFQKDFLPKFYAALGEKRRPVFLLDEFDVLDQTAEAELVETATAKALFPLLRRLITTDDRSAFVFVVGRRAEDLSLDFSATFKASLVREIWVLDAKSAEDLVRQAQINGTLKYTDDAIQRILSLTNRHPYLTQLLCQRIWELAYDSGLSSTSNIDSPQVEAALESSLETGNQALDWLWNGLNPAEKIYASALAEIAGENETIPEERIIEVLATHAARLRTREIELAPRDLVKRHVLDTSGDRGYRFAVELFRRWVHKNKPLMVVKDEVDRIDPMADRFFVFGDGFYDTRQWEKATFYFREALNVNPRHFRARLYLGETLLEQGKVDEAITELNQALILDREEARLPLARAWLTKAEILKSGSDWNVILEAYEKALELSPRESLAIQGRAAIWIQRAQQAEGRGDLLGAREAYLQAGDQNNVDRLNKLEREQTLNKLQLDAQEHIKDEHWESAVATYTQMVELALDDATRQVWQLELEKAQMQAAEQSMQAKAQATEKMKMQAREHEQREEWEKAIQIYEDLNQMGGLDTWNVLLENAKHQQEIVTTFERGRQALEQEDWKDAQQLFAKIIQVQPDYSHDGLLAAELLQDAIRHRKGIFYNLMRWPWASNYGKALKYLQDTSRLRTGDTPSIDVKKTPILQSTSLHKQAFTQETQLKELWAEIIHITRAWISVIFKPSVKSFEALVNDPHASTKRAFIQILIVLLVISLILAINDILSLVLIPLGFVVFFLFTGMTHWISQRGLGGEGSYSRIVYIYAPLTFLLFFFLGSFVVFSLWSVPIWIYSVILAVIANRAVYQFGWGKAIASYVLSIIVVGVLVGVLILAGVFYAQPTLTQSSVFTEAPVTTEPVPLVFSGVSGSEVNVYLYDAKNKTVLPKVEGGGKNWNSAIGISGNIYFTSNRDGKAEIYRLINGEIQRVTNTPENYESWAPALGKSGNIYFTSNRDGKAEIYRLINGEIQRVTNTPENYESWAPVVRGQNIYFTSNRSNRNQVYILAPKVIAIFDITCWTKILKDKLPEY